MSRQADPWWDELRAEAELPPPPAPSKTPAILGAVAAIVVSSGLAYWLSRPEAPFANAEVLTPRPQAEILRVATPRADVEQVRRAYDEFTSVYATAGVPGLARFAESCRQSLAGDPRILDFCLAFDLFAASVQSDRATAGKDEAAHLAMVHAALPGEAAPDRRIAEVRRMMRQASGVPESLRAADDAPAARDGVRRVSLAAPPPATRKRVRPAIPPTCRAKPTPADRLVCADPALGAQHRRMRAAYDKALAAGADPLAIDRGQAEWRVARNAQGDRKALMSIYERRIWELQAAARKPQAADPAAN